MKLRLLLLLFFPVILLAQNNTLYFQKKIFFENNHYILTEQSKLTLQEVLDSLPLYETYQIYLTGHTDAKGSKETNKTLSQKRCLSAQTFLKETGNLADSVFVMDFFGEEKAIADNTQEEGKKLNRRVEIEVKYVREITPEVKSTPLPVKQPLPSAPVVEAKKLESIFKLYAKTERKLQVFRINPAKDTAIRCKQGTVIYLKANAWDISKECANAEIEFRVKEDFLKSDMILDNLSTTSNGQIIETQGMVYTEAVDCKGKKLNLLPQKELVQFVPTDKFVPETKIFEGERNPHDSIMNWTVSNTSVLANFTLAELNTCDGWICGGIKPIETPCSFFFCRIKRFSRPIKGIFDSQTRAENHNFRFGQRAIRREKRWEKERMKKLKEIEKKNEIRKARKLPLISTVNLSRPPIPDRLRPKCEYLESLYKKYGVNNSNALMYAINRPLMDSLGVKTMAEFHQKMDEISQRNIELAYKNKKLSYEDFKYYVYNRSKMGWSNIDAFAKIPEQNKVSMKVNVKPNVNTDCKLVFINRNFVLPAIQKSNHYVFEGIPKEEEVWLLVLKYEDGKPWLSIQQTKISKKTQEADFQLYTIEELVEKLKILDR